MKPDPEYSRSYRSRRKERIYYRIGMLLLLAVGGGTALTLAYLAMKR